MLHLLEPSPPWEPAVVWYPRIAGPAAPVCTHEEDDSAKRSVTEMEAVVEAPVERWPVKEWQIVVHVLEVLVGKVVDEFSCREIVVRRFV